MKVQTTVKYAEQIGNNYVGQAIGFEVTPTGLTMFEVVWYGKPGIHRVAANDVEVVR